MRHLTKQGSWLDQQTEFGGINRTPYNLVNAEWRETIFIIHLSI